jgi:hypothetical protein
MPLFLTPTQNKFPSGGVPLMALKVWWHYSALFITATEQVPFRYRIFNGFKGVVALCHSF